MEGRSTRLNCTSEMKKVIEYRYFIFYFWCKILLRDPSVQFCYSLSKTKECVAVLIGLYDSSHTKRVLTYWKKWGKSGKSCQLQEKCMKQTNNTHHRTHKGGFSMFWDILRHFSQKQKKIFLENPTDPISIIPGQYQLLYQVSVT